jgi:hypothetical protein
LSKAAFKAGGRRGGDGHGVEVELGAELSGPLLDEMRGTEYGDAVDLTSVHHFTQHKACFDCFADADIVSDHEPDRRLA